MDNSVVFSDDVLSNIKQMVNCNEKQKDCRDLNYCMLSVGKMHTNITIKKFNKWIK